MKRSHGFFILFFGLQGYLPPTKNGVEPKRPSRPINITSLIRLSTTVPNTIVVSWTSEIGRVRRLKRGWISRGHKCFVSILLTLMTVYYTAQINLTWTIVFILHLFWLVIYCKVSQVNPHLTLKCCSYFIPLEIGISRE